MDEELIVVLLGGGVHGLACVQARPWTPPPRKTTMSSVSIGHERGHQNDHNRETRRNSHHDEHDSENIAGTLVQQRVPASVIVLEPECVLRIIDVFRVD